MTVRTLLHDLPACAELRSHAVNLESASIEALLAADKNRAKTFTVGAAGALDLEVPPRGGLILVARR